MSVVVLAPNFCGVVYEVRADIQFFLGVQVEILWLDTNIVTRKEEEVLGLTLS